jgi:hypothetical protein
VTLLDWARDGYSQNGDYGISNGSLGHRRRRRLRCEFDAWNGIHFHFSTTLALLERRWRAAMIEADESRLSELEQLRRRGTRRGLGLSRSQAAAGTLREGFGRVMASARA